MKTNHFYLKKSKIYNKKNIIASGINKKIEFFF